MVHLRKIIEERIAMENVTNILVHNATTADIRWLDQPEVFRINQLPAHSDHHFYSSEETYTNGENTLIQCLNGNWQFHYAINAMERPVDFYKVDYDCSIFESIKVPQHIELAGYDKIHYINTMYPWDGHVYRRGAYTLGNNLEEGMFSQAPYNPVGSYLCKFDLDESLKNKRIRISFAGVEEAMYVWLNGSFVGYAEDSFTPSDFDLTPYIQDADNILAVEVHKRSTAAFLESQDFFRFFGIFRDVNLYALPALHVEDLWLRPTYEPADGTGSLRVSMKLSGTRLEGKVLVKILDQDVLAVSTEVAISDTLDFTLAMPEPVTPWDNHNPHLYTFIAELYDANNNLIELVPYKIGFLKLELKSEDRVIYLNDKRLIINGVNRHEWSAQYGRGVTLEEEALDMKCIKDNNINSVRTCHYPNRTSWYYSCDENGIYMMAEGNLESHGSWQKMGAIEPSVNVPGSISQWEGAVVDRARTNFETFKNHISILFWSLGNESYVGECLRKMNELYKEKDKLRLVHYEGVFNNRDYEDVISDVESQMYAPPSRIREYLDNQPKKPFILCEYMHDMGNSLGGMEEYMELLDQYTMYQGGFIWDFIDQALWITDEITGQNVLRYGGDFDDKPSDYEFSGNGIVFADRTEKPAIQEVKYYYGLYK